MSADQDHREPHADDAGERGFKDALFEIVFRESIELVVGIAAIAIAAGLLLLFLG